MPTLPSPFEVFEPIPGLAPLDYTRTFDEAFALAPLPEERDPRLAALTTRRETFARRRWQEETDAADVDAFVADVRQRGVGIAGAGLMGISIAAAFLNAGIPVLARDPYEIARQTAPERARRELETLRRNTGEALPDADAEARLCSDRVAALFRTTDSLEELLRDRPVAIESTPEKPRLKAKLYRDLEKASRAPVLLLTNTSSLTIEELSATLPRDEVGMNTSVARFAGFHFFHPATKRRPVEIAVGSLTSGTTVARTAALARAIGKLPMVVGDAPGFLVNRLLQAYLNEALAALDEGVDAAAIEDACLRFGMEGAPLRVIDEIGADVSLHSGWSFFKAFPDRTHDSTILPGLVRAERLGRKTMRGFYRYESRVSWQNDATLDADRATLDALADPSAGSAIPNVAPRFHTHEALALRAAIAILFEAARLVEEGVVGSLREADAGLVLALGFPPEKGGICYWALSFGLDRLLDAAKTLEPLGARFKAPALLVELAGTR